MRQAGQSHFNERDIATGVAVSPFEGDGVACQRLSRCFSERFTGCLAFACHWTAEVNDIALQNTFTRKAKDLFGQAINGNKLSAITVQYAHRDRGIFNECQ